MTQPAKPSAAWNDALLANPHAVADKRVRVRKMFAAIAPSYDLNNRLHSLWMDQRWRKKAVTLAQIRLADQIVDVACGTGDLAIQFAEKLRDLNWDADGNPHQTQVIAVDFTYEMLPIAQRKRQPQTHKKRPWKSGDGKQWRAQGLGTSLPVIAWLNGDAQALPLPGQSADVVSIAFGIRNVQEPRVALREFFRILRPGGRVIILEFSLPASRLLRAAYNFYFRQILPRTATLISGDKTGAYKYLPQSVNTFIGREQMMAMMRDAGFTNVEQFPFTFGVCVSYRGVKP
jgi:demethylmenaquinone methyltransferase/2-methoxy-6-polyprenyl-1,4-benzoquinol methylase